MSSSVRCRTKVQKVQEETTYLAQGAGRVTGELCDHLRSVVAEEESRNCVMESYSSLARKELRCLFFLFSVWLSLRTLGWPSGALGSRLCSDMN